MQDIRIERWAHTLVHYCLEAPWCLSTSRTVNPISC
jgi:hypothetical protein